MHTIVFATHKGGCGRSTLAISLAVAAQEAGESVAIFDLDPKSCASRWGSKRRIAICRFARPNIGGFGGP